MSTSESVIKFLGVRYVNVNTIAPHTKIIKMGLNPIPSLIWSFAKSRMICVAIDVCCGFSSITPEIAW
jgi:hypothetical protein